MKQIFGTILSVLILLIQPATAIEKARQNQDAQVPWVRMHRGICYGKCPVYEIAIYEDGRVTFRGEMFTKEIGFREASIDANGLSRLKAAIDSSKFFELPGDCCNCSELTDVETVAVEIVHKIIISKKIEHYHGCTSAPKAITTLEDQIDEISGSGRWIETFEERKNSRGKF